MKSSTTASGSWPAVTLAACGWITRAGNDFANRFPAVAKAVAALPARSCIIDGEAIVCDGKGLAVFELIRGHGIKATAVHCAFDLPELDGEDLRQLAIEDRKYTLSRFLRQAHPGIVFNEHFDGDGAVIYKDTCALGCEGIVSKRLGSLYRSGRLEHWIKVKNPAAPAAAGGGGGLGAVMLQRRVPPRWMVEEREACFVVKDHGDGRCY
jgi:bifunctional non-homologous end joining protein LigD